MATYVYLLNWNITLTIWLAYKSYSNQFNQNKKKLNEKSTLANT